MESTDEDLNMELYEKAKNARSTAKRLLTRKINEIHTHMDEGQEDMELLDSKSDELKHLFERFRKMHGQLYDILTKESDKKEADTYYSEMERNTYDTFNKLATYLETEVYTGSPGPMFSQAMTSQAHSMRMDSRQAHEEREERDSLLAFLREGQRTQVKLIEMLQLPKAELMTFDGNPLSYWLFMRTFDSIVSKECDESAKLIRLYHYTAGKARKVIESCMVMDPMLGYTRARELLEERFGQGYVIAEAWIKKITTGQNIKSNDSKRLLDFSDELKNCKETLKATGYVSEINVQSTLVKIIERLPTYLQNRWKGKVLTIRREGRNPNIKDVIAFVSDSAEEANDPVCGEITEKYRTEVRVDDRNRNRPKITSYMTTEKAPITRETYRYVDKPCLKCGQQHNLFGCTEFKSMRPSERLQFATEKGLCFNCLRPDHMASACGLRRTCSVPGCGQKHTKFLHLSETQVKMASSTVGNRDSGQAEGQSFCATGAGSHMKVSLPLVPVIVCAVHGSTSKIVKTFALLDSGSTHSFCDELLAKELALCGRPDSLLLTTLENFESETKTNVVQLDVSDISSEYHIKLSSVFTRPKLPMNTDNLASHEDIRRWDHLRDLDIPSVDHHRVLLLIGQDNPDALIPLEVRRGLPGEPYATRTMFGWTLNGPVGKANKINATSIYAKVDPLESQLEKFWKIEHCESLIDDKTAMSFDDKRAIQIWEESLVQHDDKHYELSIPFKQTTPQLPNNRHMAERRLDNLKRKLEKDDKLKQSYVNYMEDLVNKGFAEKADTPNKESVVWYLPHHSVVHPKKPEKVRIVFDCAAQMNDTSLNKQVLQGPDMTGNLIGILLRFRQEQVAITADIEAMFHQVRVTPDNRDVLRFLWWPGGDFDKPPEDYRMTVHLFGGTWSPSCCNFVLQHTAKVNQAACGEEVVNTVLNNFYVDDCLKSVTTVTIAVDEVHQLCELLKTGGFKLTKWMSNNREVLASVAEDDREKEVKGLDLNNDALPVQRALGVFWDTEQDDFCYRIIPNDKPLTRRGILSLVSSVYDPLGFAAPFILAAKLIVQNLTRLKLGWDDSITDEEQRKWITWKKDMLLLETFRIKRCVKPSDRVQITETQLHLFSDASDTAYGATAYLRMRDIDSNIHCYLLMAKSRLAPIKKVSIPRLELMAATLSVKLNHLILREINIPVTQSVFWTDSTTVLAYIKSDSRRFHTFVANRVAMIRDGSDPAMWRYVDTGSNPADDASRPQTAQELLNNKRWIKGPDFLSLEEEQWPKLPEQNINILPDDNEVKKEACFAIERVNTSCDVIDRIISRRSSWYLLKREFAWILRFKDWLRSKTRSEDKKSISGMLSVTEIRQAGIEIVKYVQRQNFVKEIRLLSENESTSVQKGSPIARLSPYLSTDEVLVVGGRLNNAMIPMEAKHQVILPKCHVAEIIVKHFHEMNGHSGREHVLSLVRQHFWIIGSRTLIRKVLHECFLCKKRKVKPTIPKMADLPACRVTSDQPPFTFTGVDCFGTFLVKQGRSHVKRYGCLFTCMNIRAIHIEILHSLDTDSFINALQRFISRRGQPKEMYSDNGTNFVAAEKELRQAVKSWNQAKIRQFLQQSDIQWNFNPPAASHMGGVWERQIRSVRNVISAVAKEQVMNDEGLETLMCLVESIVNSRPLTTVSDDINDPEPLTPNHLLLLRSGPAVPPGEFERRDLLCRKRWRQIQYLADVFWRRWVKEYLPTLQQRQRWLKPTRNLAIGDVVLVVDDNSPRNSWSLGRIVSVHTAKDGCVRSADVKTAISTLTRPVAKLCLLEAVE